MSIDEAVSVGVVPPTSFWVFEPSQAGAFFLTGAKFVSMGIGPSGEFCAIASNVEIVLVNQSKVNGVVNCTRFEDRVDSEFEVCEVHMVRMFLDMVG